MKLEFLGTGTSQGVPVILCDCEVCQSTDPKDNRLRPSVWVTAGDISVIVDATPDFRQQCLRTNIKHIDAIFISHLHADHFFGLDDVRQFNRLQQSDIPLYLPKHMEEHFKNVFAYTLIEHPPHVYRPRFDLKLIDVESIKFDNGLIVEPIVVWHGSYEIRGYCFEFEAKRMAYITDCKYIDPKSIEQVKNLDILILSALWKNYNTHPSHLTLEEAIEMNHELKPKKCYFNHITHHMGLHAETSKEIPENCFLAYDQLVIEL